MTAQLRARAAAATPPQRAELVRILGLLDCTSIIIGIVIGSGIFLTPGLMARDLPSPMLLLAVWALGGLISLAGALTFAELAAAMPDAGGQYVYLRRAYGPFAAFLFGWITFVVYQTGAIAAVAVGFAEYLGYFLPAAGVDVRVASLDVGFVTLRISAGQVSACVAIILLTIINVRALKAGSVTQNLLTFLKVGAIGVFIVFGFWAGDGGAFAREDASSAAAPRGLLVSLGVALVAVLWTYDGWNNVTFSGGEVRDPGRTLPRALLLGTIAATVIYVLTVAAYLNALPIADMRDEPRIAEKAATVLFGPGGAMLISAAVMVSTLGAVNGIILTAARVYYAMARDGLFFAPVASVHPRFRTPHVSLWLQCAWACGLALSGSYDQLITYAIFAGLLTYAAAAASVFALRIKEPDMPRPYRVWGYPVLPAVFLLAVLGIIATTLMERPLESFSGLALLAIGVPVYLTWRRRGPVEAG
jgi:basic amino acid/polyamine antiporter, APA family